MIRDYYVLIIKEMSAHQVSFSLQNPWSREILRARKAQKKPGWGVGGGEGTCVWKGVTPSYAAHM